MREQILRRLGPDFETGHHSAHDLRVSATTLSGIGHCRVDNERKLRLIRELRSHVQLRINRLGCDSRDKPLGSPYGPNQRDDLPLQGMLF